MNKIKVMSELLANKIAAGEVIEKCVSIVKELVENAIDAKSTIIKVQLEESGLKRIVVIDNGVGMSKEDANLAFIRHATSKLYNDDDLFAINTLGFRGEALPSIAAVSLVTLKTCHEHLGTMIQIKGGKILKNEASELREGTSIEVTNLFYNTPARLKHLSSPYSELANIVSYLHKIALSYPCIKFKLSNDDKELFNTPGDGNLLKVINAIYGLDVTKKMIPVSSSNDDYTITGYLSLPELTRQTKDHMITLVNGRVIRHQELNRVINEAYHTYKEDTRYPIVVFNITVDPSLIDVNIHPNKLDIKFSNEDDLKDTIQTMIINALNDKLLIPKIETKEIDKKPYEVGTLKLDNVLDNLTTTNNIDYEYKNKLEDYLTFSNPASIQEETLEETYIEQVAEDQKLECLYPIGLALGTYIICQNEKGLYLIDQHAAKERINYEKYAYLLSHPSREQTALLVPINIELPLNEFIIIEQNLDIISNIGIDIVPFGSNSFRISAHPTWFPRNGAEQVIRKVIELVLQREKEFNLARFNDRLAMNISCKMSIKANTNISLEEMQNLINDLRKCDNPFTCPHGRPTIIHYSIHELEKLFKRSI